MDELDPQKIQRKRGRLLHDPYEIVQNHSQNPFLVILLETTEKCFLGCGKVNKVRKT